MPFAELIRSAGSGATTDTLTFRWRALWQPSTSALLELAGVRGVTLDQAAAGCLRADAGLGGGDPDPPAVAALALLEGATECGLADLASEALALVGGVVTASGSLAECLRGLDLIERATGGLVPGLAAEVLDGS